VQIQHLFAKNKSVTEDRDQLANNLGKLYEGGLQEYEQSADFPDALVGDNEPADDK